jgi:hypothetical protein
MGNRMADIPLTGIPLLSDTYAPEFFYAQHDVPGLYDVYVTQETLNIEPIDILSDPETDLYDYATFDFEFTENNTLQQKEIAVTLEAILTEKGLTRDRNNPELLVFIEFYSDRREQYVPPSQQIKTRYGIGFNWLSGKLETRPRIESHETGDYTRVDYLSKFSLAMADAKKMRAGGNDFTVWQAYYEAETREKTNRKEFCEKIGSAMLAGFPYKSVARVRHCQYWFTGMVYDSEVPGKVVGVIPDSPADKAGIKAGDRIKKCSAGHDQIYKRPYSAIQRQIAANTELYHVRYSRFALTRETEFRLWHEWAYNRSEYPFANTYMSYRKIAAFSSNDYEYRRTDYDQNPPIFTVESGNKKTRKVTVTPIYRVYKDYVLSK